MIIFWRARSERIYSSSPGASCLPGTSCERRLSRTRQRHCLSCLRWTVELARAAQKLPGVRPQGRCSTPAARVSSQTLQAPPARLLFRRNSLASLNSIRNIQPRLPFLTSSLPSYSSPRLLLLPLQSILFILSISPAPTCDFESTQANRRYPPPPLLYLISPPSSPLSNVATNCHPRRVPLSIRPSNQPASHPSIHPSKGGLRHSHLLHATRLATVRLRRTL